MDRLDKGKRELPPGVDNSELGDDGMIIEEGTFRGNAGNRDVRVRKKRTVSESSLSEEPPRHFQRIDRRSAEVPADRVKLSKDEKKAFSAGSKKGTADGKKSITLDEEALKKAYLRTKLGKNNGEAFSVYLRGYRSSNGPARGHARAPLEQAERAGNTNGANAARQGHELKSDEDLKASYKASHPGAGDEEVNAYVSAYKVSYERAKGTPLEQAERAGKTIGANAARQGHELKSDEDLKASYKASHPGAGDEKVNAYVSAYKVSYEGAKGTPLEQAECLGNRNGANAARQGVLLKSEEDLAAWYKKSHPGAGDEVEAYVSAYKVSYEGAKGTPLEQAERLGKVNGGSVARQGNELKSDEDLKASYKASHPGAGDEEVNAYVSAYKVSYDESKGTPLEQAERLGNRNGAQAARHEVLLKSEEDLAAWYNNSHTEASDSVAKAYAEAYVQAYNGVG